MADITESAVWEDSIYELATTDPVKGGTPVIGGDGSVVSGHANVQAQKLANRTKYLKQRVDAWPEKVDAAGTAFGLVTAHNNNPNAHPELLSVASSAAERAEAAADAAQASGNVYDSAADGLAATSTGQYFSVPSEIDNNYITLYRNSAGVAVEVKTYPSSKLVEKIVSKLPDISPLDYVWSVLDGENNAAIGIKEDGTFATAASETETMSTKITDIVGAGSVTAGQYPTFALTVSDSQGNASLCVADDGVVHAKELNVSDLVVKNVNGVAYTSNALSRFGGVYSHQINFINNTGQSLGEGSTPAVDITTSQEYDNIGFPARSLNPTAFVQLTTANTKVSGRGESPMYGTLGHIKELISEENGISFSVNDYQLVTCNNAYSGYSILALNKGTTPYSTAISQVQSAFNLSQSLGKTMSFQVVTWTQGEADTGMAKDTYKGHLHQLAIDYNNDGKTITGQFNDVKLICYQCATANRNIALAQLEASNESSLIYMACPMYQFEYGDSQHITAESSKWLGGYYGLVYKRVVVDRQEWEPLQPVAHAINGNSIDLIFNKSGLVLDTTLVPAQADYGFQVVNAGNTTIPISAVSVVGSNRVRITLASAPTTGSSVRYGFNSAVGKGVFTGGCGNLRDRQGDTIIYSAVNKPMHNWSVIFSYLI